MSASTRSRFPLLFLAVICFAGLIPSLLAWAVNLEAGLAAVFSSPIMVLPEELRTIFLPVALDLSTISTLIPVLLLLYPFTASLRILRHTGHQPVRTADLVYDPYPPHFPFFLVMLGLVGTLYGLYIGLDVSGVNALSTSMPSPEAIQQSIDRLLGGTATALLSSLLGLVGAFLAARPLTWIFHRAAGLSAEDDSVSLSESLHHLSQELVALSESTHRFRSELDETDMGEIGQALSGLRPGLESIQTALADQTAVLKQMAEHQMSLGTRLESLENLNELQRLKNLESNVGTQNQTLQESQALLAKIQHQQDAHARAAQDSAVRAEEQQQATRELMQRLAEEAGSLREQTSTDRKVFKKALREYLSDAGAEG